MRYVWDLPVPSELSFIKLYLKQRQLDLSTIQISPYVRRGTVKTVPEMVGVNTTKPGALTTTTDESIVELWDGTRTVE